MKMKKSLIFTLIFVTTFVILSSCNAKKTETVAELNLRLSDNLPGFNMKGHYTEAKSNIELNPDDEVLWGYSGDDNSEYRYAYAYKWPNTGKSLLDETKADAKKYFPLQEPEVIICDDWYEPGDSEYAYYAAIKDDKYMAQIWTFEDGDYFYQISVGYDLIPYTVEGTNLQFSIPAHLKKVETDTALMAFVDPDAEIKMQEFPNIEIYLDDGDFEFTAENIAKKWKVDNVEVLEHEFTSNDKNTKIPGYRISCEYTKNGKIIVCRDDLVKTGDKFFAMEFSYDKSITFSEYIENSYRAFLYTIVEK